MASLSRPFAQQASAGVMGARDGLYDGTVAGNELLNVALSSSIANRAPRSLLKPVLILLLTIAGFAVMGYHPGFEDDEVYLSAVKARLNPSLYPHDSDFVRLQLQASIFDECMAGIVRITHIPLPWAELLCQLASLFTILWGAHGIAQMLFSGSRAAWAATALLSALFTLPVAGTAINIADQHLHPRNIATALILVAIQRVLARKPVQAIALLAAAALVHPLMASFGASFCLFLGWVQTGWARSHLRIQHRGMLAAFPLAWVFDQPTTDWRRALETRTYYFLSRWTWYEWLGAIGPLVIFALLWMWTSRPDPGRRSENSQSSLATASPAESGGKHSLMERVLLALLLYGVFQQLVAQVVLGTPALVRLTPLQPMRYLQLEYIFLVVLAGGFSGQHWRGRELWLWAALLPAINGSMFFAQRRLVPASQHLELPGRAPVNPWLQAFAWIRENTPPGAYFALDPMFLAQPGEDYHGFRALAERSRLADGLKDAAVATQVPELAARWSAQVDASPGWGNFQAADFERLNTRFGADWALVPYPAPPRLICMWHNDLLAVCTMPKPQRPPGP
jgi:hypothetical protein